MNEMDWYFPETLEEASKLLNKGQPHSGGTAILRMSMNRIQGLIDLARLNLDYFRKEGGIIRIGALQTYAGVVKNIRKMVPQHILVKALTGSASESLRNRITVGGSVAAFRIWSDIMGPLLALEAEVSIIGKARGSYPISQYVGSQDLKKGTIITEISFNQNEWISSYHRETRTSFDYAIFTITILLKKIEDRIDDIRVVFIGTKKRFMRLHNLEESLRGMPINKVNLQEVVSKAELDFPPKQSLSPDYINHLAHVQLERGFTEILWEIGSGRGIQNK